jgi:hypothetical protein
VAKGDEFLHCGELVGALDGDWLDGLLATEGSDVFREAVCLIEHDERVGFDGIGRDGFESGNFTYRSGDFFGGERLRLNSSVSWRPNRHFRASIESEYNDIELSQGNFIVRLVRLQLETAFSSTLSWVNLIQYDNVSELVGLNSRVHWIPRAGREGFIVLNHNLEDFDRDNSFHSAFAELTLKFGYTFRF